MTQDGPAVAYFEADVEYSQSRRLATTLPAAGKLSRLPFFLLPVPEREADLPALNEALRNICAAKKRSHITYDLARSADFNLK